MHIYYHNLGSLFLDTVNKHAQDVALRYAGQHVTYAELMDLAERLGSFLLGKNIRQGDVLAIGHNKEKLSYALMMACIRLGITYVSIDVKAPVARNARIIETSKAQFILYDDSCCEQLMRELAFSCSCHAIEITSDLLPLLSKQDKEQQNQLMQQVDASSIAYIMFTSGSTGIPKGVAVTHQNVLHFISWGRNCFKIQSGDNFAQLSPMYFDNSVFDFYVALFSGASLTPIHRDLLTKPYELAAYIEKMECSIWFSVPSLLIYLMTMKAMSATMMSAIRCIIFGGEGYPKSELKKLYDVFSDQASLVNVYGPTECTCICSAYFLSEADFSDLDGLPPLGRLNVNFDYKILDEQGLDATKGELCLLGPNVAAGYFNDPERTAVSFQRVTDAYRFMKPMYQTGDIVEKRDGLLHFIGRKDNQIKHMGYRIELEEIEQALVKLPHINQAAVMYHRSNAAYGKIIAFIASTEFLEETDVLHLLSEFLPDYMIPSRLFIKNTLPKNPNGKVDRQQLLIAEAL